MTPGGVNIVQAVDAGLRAVLVSPIPYASDAVGVVAVFSAKPFAWTPEGELALMAFTDLAAFAIATTVQSERRGELAGHLQIALENRAVIEQAKGVLVAQDGLNPRQAFEKLRARAAPVPATAIRCGRRRGKERSQPARAVIDPKKGAAADPRTATMRSVSPP